MRVISKFAIVFFAAAIVCLSVFAYVVATREAARLDRALTAGLASYGRALRPVLESAWREGGYGAAERVVRGFGPDSELRVHLARDGLSSAPQPEASEIDGVDGVRLIQLRLGIDGPDGEHALLTLGRPTTTGGAIIRDELVDQAIAAGALATIMAILAVVLGAILIGQPLGRIAVQARRIGEGDLSQRLRATSPDEIGVLARELNAMCDRLVEANARLEEESTARIETLETLRHLDRLRTVGTIASGIAHELGTPLNVLLLRGQALVKGACNGSEEVRDAGSVVVSQVQKMSRIVRQLLDFVRSRSGSVADVSELVVEDVAEHAVFLLASMGKKHGVFLLVERAREPTKVRGDFGQLEQALTNLIVNGIQAMPRGGDLRIRVASDEDETAVITVSDTGDGMTTEVCERVFEPFFTTKPRAEGTGLGLHVARGIVEDHRGSITVASERGRGTTFTIRLPRYA